MSAAPIDLHYWPTPNGRKITLFLEEAGLPYRVVPVNIGRGEQFRPEFLAIAPNNRMPAIVDPDGPGGAPISVFESGAILQYLGDKTGRFYATEPRLRTQINEWLFWQMGGLGPMLGQANHFAVYAPEKLPYAVDRYMNEAQRLGRVLDERLANHEFIAGEYSIADMACFPWTQAYARLGIDTAQWTNMARWREAILARPATRKALDVGKDWSAGAKPLKDDEEAKKHLFGQR